MASGIMITHKGRKGFFPAEIVHYLQSAKKAYRADEIGMGAVGEPLASSFIDYCDLNTMQNKMNETGHAYKYSASHYASSYNSLFEIDF